MAFVRHKVQDFDKWLEGYRGYADIQKDLRIIGGDVSQSVDNPEQVVVTHDFEELGDVHNYMNLPNLKDLMKAIGVVGEPEIWVTKAVQQAVANHGYLIIADIFGYTKFLAETEIEHSKGIIEQLFATIMPAFVSPFKISGVQGDAVFAYTVDDDIAAKQFTLDFAERVYCSFSRAKHLIGINSDCPCKACAGVDNLDLKFILHYGAYMEQQIGGNAELTGVDVIRTFRLLKNSVTERTGKNAYMLMTAEALAAMGIGDYFCETDRFSETYDHIGTVDYAVHDLSEVWQKNREVEAVFVGKDDRLLVDEFVVDLPVGPDTAFTLCTRPDLRTRYINVDKLELSSEKGRRLEKGTTFRCHHSGEITPMEIVDWRPGEYLTVCYRLPTGLTTLKTTEFTALHHGTKAAVRYGPAEGGNLMGRLFNRMIAHKLRTVRSEDYKGHMPRLAAMAAAYNTEMR